MTARVALRPHHRLTFGVLCLGIDAYSLMQSLVAPVLPTIQHHLHTSQQAVSWVMTAYLLSASVATPIFGRIGDMAGKERMLIVALVALGAGSLLAAVAGSITVMIVARVVQGFGGGTIPLAFGIIRDESPAEKVPGAIGLAAASTAIGGGVATVLAGPIVDGIGYRWLFLIPMFVTLGAALATYLYVPEPPVRTPGRINLAAAALLSGWLIALLVPVSEAPHWGWASARVIASLALAVVLAALWILTEVRSVTPLIDMRMMRSPAVWTTNVVAILLGANVYVFIAFLPEFVQTPASAGYGFGAGVTESSTFMMPMTVAMLATGVVTGRLTDRIGAKSVLVIGEALTAMPMVMLGLAHSQRWEVYLASLGVGFGTGLAFASMSALIVTVVRPDQTGAATGMNANIRTMGGSIGTAVMVSIVTAGATADGFPTGAGYTNGFFFLAAVAAVGLIAALGIPIQRLGRIEVREWPAANELSLPATDRV